MLDKNTNKPTPPSRYESIAELNLISLWVQSGRDWSATIKNEIQADIEQPSVQEESNTTSKVVLFGVLATLAILIAITCSQATQIYQSVQQVGINIFKELVINE